MSLWIFITLLSNNAWAAPVTCIVEGVEYLAKDGSVYACVGGGNWCDGAPARSGICGSGAVSSHASGATCLVGGITYAASTGAVVSCAGGGNWCSGVPARPGVCAEKPAPSTLPNSLHGLWSYAFGYCRGSGFTLSADRVTYMAAHEGLGAGRIVRVQPFGAGWTIETILHGEGKFLSIWPTEESSVMAYGLGITAAASRAEHCRVTKM